MLLSYRKMLKEVNSWLATPEFRRKLILNLGELHRMKVPNPATFENLGNEAFARLKDIRPKNEEELKVVMRPHELLKITQPR